MDLKDFEERYKGFTTDKLKELAEGFEGMRKDVLPILFNELESRGEHEFVVNIKNQIANYQPPEDDFSLLSTGTTGNTFHHTGMIKKDPIESLLDDDEEDMSTSQKVVDKSLAGEVLDDELTMDLFTYSDTEIVDLAVKLIMKKKKELNSWKSAKALVNTKWNVTEETFLKINEKLERKRNNNQLIAIAIGAIFIIGIFILIASEGETGFVPGILFLLWGGSAANTARHLKRILGVTDDIYDIID